MDPYKARFAGETAARTIADALVGADVFVGLSVAGAVTREMVAQMATRPIIFALANPVPEITAGRGARRCAPTRSSPPGAATIPNQVNNVLGFPFIFRGALDVRATEINEEMKMAATRALAALAQAGRARFASPRSTGSATCTSGADYLIPFPFDPRVLLWVAPAVAWAAVASGVARGVHRPRGVPRPARGAARPRARASCAASSTAPSATRSASSSPRARSRRSSAPPRMLVDEGIAVPDPARQPGDASRTSPRCTSIPLDDITIEDPATSPQARRVRALHVAAPAAEGALARRGAPAALQRQLLRLVHGGARRRRRAALRREPCTTRRRSAPRCR